MDPDNNNKREQLELRTDKRAERGFDLTTLVLACLLGAIIFTAVAYGVLRTPQAAVTMIPSPRAVYGTIPTTAQGSDSAEQHASGKRKSF